MVREKSQIKLDSVSSSNFIDARKPSRQTYAEIREVLENNHICWTSGSNRKSYSSGSLHDPQDEEESEKESLVQENRRLRSLVKEYERMLEINPAQSSNNSSNSSSIEETVANSHCDSQEKEEHKEKNTEESLFKLKEKIKLMKSKRKHDKLLALQMEKEVDAYRDEIKGLQYELDRTLFIVEKMEKEGVEKDKQIKELNEKFKEAKAHGSIISHNEYVENLKSNLQKRDSEVGAALELLQSKVERIIELEHEVKQYRKK